MPTIRIGTFNCENLFSRYKFLDEPFSGKHYVDFIKPVSVADSLMTFGPGRDDIPLPREITRKQRRNTAEVVFRNKPDILAVEEVENLPTMRLFNTHYLQHHFKYSVLIEGNDNMRMIDVGLYSNYLKFPREGGQGAENLRTESRHVHPTTVAELRTARKAVRTKASFDLNG